MVIGQRPKLQGQGEKSFNSLVRVCAPISVNLHSFFQPTVGNHRGLWVTDRAKRFESDMMGIW